MNERLSLAQALHTLERSERLFDFRIDGWSAWRVMRNAVHRRLMALPLSNAGQPDHQRAVRALHHTTRLLWSLVRRPRRELLVKTSRSGLRMQAGDRFRDVYFDGLLQAGHGAVKLEEINTSDFAQQSAAALFPADLDPVVFTFWGRLLGALWPARRARGFCERSASLLQRELGMSITARWLLMRVSTVVWQARLYRLLLASIQPRAVLVADTGEYALCIAARRSGVRFIELQHGVFDSEHPDAVPLWVPGDAAALVLPDRLACLGDYWIARLQGTRQGRDLAVAVGNESIDRARERRRARPHDGTARIVLSSQGLDSERLAAWVRTMLHAAPSGLLWKLVIKLHPVYDAQTRAFDALTADPRVQVVPGGQAPSVFDLLAAADLHMSIASACHFDAAALGVISVVVPLAGHETMLPAIDGRHFRLAGEPAAIWPLLQATALHEADAEHFSASGFIANMRGLIA